MLQGWTAPTEMTECNPTDAKKFAALQELQLKSQHGIVLQKMRAAYFVQMLVDVAANTADSVPQLWQALKDEAVLQKLSLMDSCCMNGPGAFCMAWSHAVTAMATTATFDIAAALAAADIKVFTQEGRRILSGLPASATDGSDMDVDEDSKVRFQSIDQLLNYGSSGRIPPADVLEAFRLELQKQVLLYARTPVSA